MVFGIARRRCGSRVKPKERRYLAKLFGESSQGRGNVSEELLLVAVKKAGSAFPWFLFARPALADEDCRGIDIVVFVRGGARLFLQSKSSHGRAASFKSKKRKDPIEVVVVSLDEIKNLRRAREALERAYGETTCLCGINVVAQAPSGEGSPGRAFDSG